MCESAKIVILTCPYTGHCNPVLAVCHSLTSLNKHMKIIVYGDEKFQKLFEKAGAIFRAYKSSALDSNMNNPYLSFVEIIVKGIKVADKNVIDLYDDVRNELPDLIMYDKSPLYPKFMIEYFVQEMRRERLKMFKIIGYDTALHMDSDYPNQFERKFMEFNLSMKKLFNLFNYLNMRRVYMKKVIP